MLTTDSSHAVATAEFRSGGSFSVGAEEELFLLDSSDRLTSQPTESLLAEVRQRAAPGTGTVCGELYVAQIEFATDVCLEAEAIVPQLARLRSALVDSGGRALAAGLHPEAPFGEVALNPAPRYQGIGASLAGLLRTPTAALQVHVGLPDEQAALLAYRGIRHQLPIIQALAVNSPFWHGRDSGMSSARWAIISSYPRHGIPPVVRTWGEYTRLLETVVAAAQAPDQGQIWWDARLQPRLGTLEVRAMDAQPSLSVAAGLVALIQGLVRHAVENPVAGDVPSEILAENSFRTARYGLDTTVTDCDGLHRPVRELALEAVRDARRALEDGSARPLQEIDKLLAEPPEPQRQREIHARSGIRGVVADLVERTRTGS